jgi:putative transferase (TIGR04331 family)
VSKESRHLIASADERTWKFDRPVIFLGEWCRLYDRKHIWQSMDAILAEPYGLGMANKDADFSEAKQLEDKYFPILCNILNEYHKTNHRERFWRILLGHWFHRYINVVLNRYKTFEKCLKLNNISGVTVYENKHYALAPLDSYSAIWAFNDTRWNDSFFLQMLIFLGDDNFHVELINEDILSGFEFKTKSVKFKKTFLKWCREKVSKILSIFVKNTDALIINTYLPLKQAIKLHLIYGQIPQLYDSQKFNATKKPDLKIRQALGKSISNDKKISLDCFVAKMLFQLLPVCYLEGFEDLNNLVKRYHWPKQPKFIFTSNNFDTDEAFKLWTAIKTEAGYQYIVGQHGNNYGTYKYMNPSIEEMTADKFITWGWANNEFKYHSAFNLKMAGIKPPRYNLKGGLLLIESCLNHRITTWDSHAEFCNYFVEQQDFVSKLDVNVTRQLTIRLHAQYQLHSWSEVSRWNKFNPNLIIECGDLNINELTKHSRLVIHSYDSTGMLETLSQNIPTIAFWQNGLDHLREKAKPFYELLIEVGIVHLSPFSAASKVNNVWPNVLEWWWSPPTQEARIKFCNYYSTIEEKPIRRLKAILNS